MAAIHALKNQYLGINAHLHSLLQNEGGWDSFHGLHVGDIAKTLQAELFPMGYVADYEPSLQIRRAGEPLYAPESDVSVYDPDPTRVQQPRAPTAITEIHEAVVEIPKILRLAEDEIATYKAVGIYQKRVKKPDEPIVWIELLSPSNKPRGRHFETYEEKRRLLLETGIVFVEIDYLHQSPPMYQTNEISDYTRQAEGAYPYRIVLIDPHPDLLDGVARLVEFAVDHHIPKITMPLSGDDKLRFDFGVPYIKTFEEMFYGSRLDYSQLPLKFDSYSALDQQRIASRMLWMKRAAASNLSLENAPQPVELLPLEDVLAQLKA